MNDISPETTRRWIAACAPELLDAFDRMASMMERHAEIRPVNFVLTAPDNATYAAKFLVAASYNQPVWCHNPKWGVAEKSAAHSNAEAGAIYENSPGIFIPTGGTGGKIRFVRHDLSTLTAAVSGFSTYAGEHLLRSGRPAKLHAVQALPCCHVSGLMPVVRAWLTGGELVFANPSFRPEEPLPVMPATADGLTVVSLVAAQLHRLLDRADGPAWLREAGLVLVGGSSVAPALLDRARAEKIPVGVSYGLTETAALAALFPPERFLAGEPVSGDVLPHLRAEITSQGRIAFSGKSVARDEIDGDGRYVTGDEGFFDEAGRLVVTGRADRIIVSGGEKIDPALVEAAILATGLVREVLVTSEPDAEWGRRLVALVYPETPVEPLKEAVARRLSGVFVPKVWVQVTEPLYDAKGKIDRERVRRILTNAVSNDA